MRTHNGDYELNKFNYVSELIKNDEQYNDFPKRIKSINDCYYSLEKVNSFYLLKYLYEQSHRSDFKKSSAKHNEQAYKNRIS